MNNWYVYRHIRLDNNEPFYIGIGNKSKYARAYEFKPDKRNVMWSRIFSKSEISVDIIMDGLTKEQASDKEKEFISIYGRKDLGLGSLCNMTNGGDGVWCRKMSEETKNKIRLSKIGEKNPMFGKKQSEETKLKRKKSTKKIIYTKEDRFNASLRTVKSGQALSTEVICFKTNKSLGIYHSMSEACRSIGLDPVRYSGKASLVARGIRKYCLGYVFKYLNNK